MRAGTATPERVAEPGLPELAREVQPTAARAELTAHPRTPRGVGALLLVVVAAVLADGLGAPGTLRAGLTLAVVMFLPGYAVLSRMRFGDRASATAMTVAASFSVEILVALLMAWTGFWHPVVAAVVLGAASLIVLAAGPWRAGLDRGQGAFARVRARASDAGTEALLLGGPLMAGIALWLVSLPSIHASSFGESGLVGQAPILFYIGLAAIIGGAAYVASRRNPNGWLLAGYLVAVLLFLYGTIPSIASAPQYAWTYKHIGVTRLIGQTGTVHPNVDIYNRWPGFFALAAAFSAISGVDSLSYAGWAEFLFAALQALTLGAIVYRMTGRRQIAGLSTLLWLVTNWIGQTYFSPQALAYFLDLAIMLVLVPGFRATGWVSDRLVAILQRVLRVPEGRRSALEAPVAPSRAGLVLVLLFDAAAVCSHQLTPYMVAVQVIVLTALGLRPRWLIVALLALTIAYLIPNYSWVQAHYGLFSGLNPVDNAQVQRLQAHRAWFYSHVGGLLSATTLLLGGVSAARLTRVGLARRALVPGLLALAPFALLLGNNYGGEGSLRVFLFASPWLATLIGWALTTLRPSRRMAASVALAAALTTLFLFAFIGNAGTNVIPADEVTASEYYYAHAPAHSVLILAGEDFPLEAGPRYRFMAGPGGDHSPNLLEQPQFRNRRFGPADVPRVIRAIEQYSHSGYIAFSTTQDRYAVYFGTTPHGAFEQLEKLISASSSFRLWYRSANVRIYRLVAGS